MRKARLLICSVMLPLVLASCASPPHANQPSPPAWMMQPAPDLLTPLNGIISPSESESK
ncbi:Rz1 family lipoprotein [Serratia ureilytica]|uniref:Rz1 family lipoprotein n=1 Tax=Serratia ureilytica TaxID=300181 RepID=UPI0018D8CBC0|nr:Rz1 family lipoprotein [Serratia ureilytica]MBH2720155.1 Rz1 family lipoprotein [Serratia ureilytica]